MKLKRLFVFMTIAILTLCLCLTIEAKQIELNVGTAGMGGAYYPMGQGLGNLVTDYVEDVSMVPVVTGGSVANPRLASDGEIDFGLTNANLAYFGYLGEGKYDKKLNISAVIPLHPSLLHIIALADSPINSFTDIKGKKVGVGTAGGGTIAFIKNLLKDYEMTIEEITPSFLSYADEFTQLGDKNLDICFMLAGYPASAATQIAATHKIKFIDLEDEHFVSLIKEYPYYTKIVVPKDVYKLEKDAQAIGVPNVLIVNNDLDEELVYQVTKAIVENLDELREMNATAKQIDLNRAKGIPIPFHPGAERYLKEVGILD